MPVKRQRTTTTTTTTEPAEPTYRSVAQEMQGLALLAPSAKLRSLVAQLGALLDAIPAGDSPEDVFLAAQATKCRRFMDALCRLKVLREPRGELLHALMRRMHVCALALETCAVAHNE